MAFRITTLAAALILLSHTAVAQQDPVTQTIVSDTVWTSDSEAHEIFVTNNATLVLRGMTLTLGRVIQVDPGATLRIEPTEQQAAEVRSRVSHVAVMLILGHLEIAGTPERPVAITGMGGEALTTGDSLLIEGGIVVAGTATIDHLELTDYTAGIRLVDPAVVKITNSKFSSREGLGLIVTGGKLNVATTQFRGAGATIWLSYGEFAARQVDLVDSVTPISVTGGKALVEQATILSNVTRCVRVSGGHLDIRGMECTGFAENGILVAKGQKADQVGSLDARGVHVWSTNMTRGSGVNAVRSINLTIADSVVGPLPLHGIRVEGTPFDVRNVTFEGVGSYNLFILESDRSAPFSRIGDGEPGRDGWLWMGHLLSANIRYENGTPAPYAEFAARYLPNGTLALGQIANAGGGTAPTHVVTFKIGADGAPRSYSYGLAAADSTGTARWKDDEYVADGRPVEITLAAPVEVRETPGVGLVFICLMFGAFAIARARRE